MARICTRCNRPLDEEHHDTEQRETKLKSGLIVKQPLTVRVPCNRGRGRFGMRSQRVWKCRMSLVARLPGSGKAFHVDHPQRISELQTAFVHDDRVKPGGDLHA